MDRDELIRFRGHRLGSQQHQIWSDKDFVGHFLACLQSPEFILYGRILMNLITVILPGPHDTDDIFKVVGSKVKVTDNVFQKCTFPMEVS